MYHCACLVPLILWFSLLSRLVSEMHFLEKQGKAIEPETSLLVENVSFKRKEQKDTGIVKWEAPWNRGEHPTEKTQETERAANSTELSPSGSPTWLSGDSR